EPTSKRMRASVSAAALVRDLHLDAAYLSRILKRFRAEGLIETSPDPDDLRSQVIIVTDRGREQVEKLGRRANAQIAARVDK
ncbi:MarR family transcriptional regulator, partial [Rhizobium leguminosarum]|uniref:MarR family transcriptional regulator n=1 Tax=Rhizobium leguminosarum TaxID=384 RepID=UPI003F99E8E7